MGIRIEGLWEMERRLQEIARKLPKERDKFLDQEAELLRGRAVSNTPVGKVNGGTLKGAWTKTKPIGGSIEVYNNEDYAAYVEYGHRLKYTRGDKRGQWVKDSSGKLKFVPGSHMLREAVEETKTAFHDDAERLLGRLLQ